jgi:serine/threonine protein kinase
MVFRAKHVKSGKKVVLKVIQKKDVLEDGVLKQLQREVEIHSRCRHPNIVRMHCYFTDKERVYLVLELCNKGTLFDLLHRAEGKCLEEDEARHIFDKVVQALKYLRECKAVPIIHRDIKPENILLHKDKETGEMSVKLGDFGWAVEHVPTSVRTTLCGTPEYLPPEVARSERYSGAFDIWTLGVLLFEMLTGTTPFALTPEETEGAEDPTEAIMEKITHSEIVIPEGVSSDAADLLRRLLDRNPHTRITLDEVVAHPFMFMAS